MSVLDSFKIYLKDSRNWHYDSSSDLNVYLDDPDYVIETYDPGPLVEIGSQWWGYHLRKKQRAFGYRLICKNREVCTIPMLSYENEEFTIPFPDRRTLLNPNDSQHELDIDHFCDIWYFNTKSLDYNLLYFLRDGEQLTSPLGSHIKPGIVSLPILFIEGSDAAQKLSETIFLRLPQFPKYRDERVKEREPSDDLEELRLHERLFSEWVLDIWQSRP